MESKINSGFNPLSTSDQWPTLSRQQFQALYEASLVISTNLDLKKTLESIVLSVRHKIGFDRAGIWLYDKERGGLRGSVGTDRQLRLCDESNLFIPLSKVNEPTIQVLTRRIPYFLTQDLEKAVPPENRVGMEGVKANVIVPLEIHGEILGVLSADNLVTQRAIPEESVLLLRLFATFAAAAVINAINAEERAKAVAQERIQSRLEAKVKILELCNQIAQAFTSLETDRILRTLRDGLINVLGFDRAGILLLDPKDPRYLQGTWGTDSWGRLKDEHNVRYRIEDFEDLKTIMKGDSPYLLHHISSADRPGLDQGEKHVLQHALIPLRGGKKIIGVLSVDNLLTQRPITEEDVEALLVISGHASAALEKARLYTLEQVINQRLQKVLAREKKIASTLQKCFVPSIPSRINGFRIAHLYRPALAEAEVGGDFYDILPLTKDLLFLAIADVSGKGLTAATQAALTRYALQAYAFEDPSPLAVVQRTNRFLHRFLPEDAFVTLLYILLDLKKGTGRYAIAGHEPAMLYRAKGHSVETLEGRGLVLGYTHPIPVTEYAFELEEGDALLLYSDGVTEARHQEQFFGYDQVREILHFYGHRSPEFVIRHIYSQVLRFSNGRLRDDVALMLIKHSPGRKP